MRELTARSCTAVQPCSAARASSWILTPVTPRPLRPAIRPDAGLRLKQARLRARMRQYQLGALLGFRSQRSAQEAVHAIECGRTHRVDRVIAAATALGVPLDEVIELVPL